MATVTAHQGFSTPAFLFFLALASSNFTAGGLLNCELQRRIQKDPWIQNMLMFVCAYFSVSFSTYRDGQKDMGDILLRTLEVFIVLRLLFKSDARVAILAILLIFVVLIVQDVADHYKHQEEENDELLGRLENSKAYIEYTLVGILVIGCLLYMTKHPKSFSFVTFFGGTGKCKN
jgi:hypothetical protein